MLNSFLSAATPDNIFSKFHNGVIFSFSIDTQGLVLRAELKLCSQQIDLKPLLHLPEAEGYRSFDAFYHLINSATQQEKEILSIKDFKDYNLLNKSNTYSFDNIKSLILDDSALSADWRQELKSCGFKGSEITEILSVLSAILLLGNAKENDDDLIDGATLLNLEPEVFQKYQVEQVITTTYIKLIDFIVSRLNELFLERIKPVVPLDSMSAATDDGICSVINIIDLPYSDFRVLRSVFDDTIGINSELVNDGFTAQPISTAVSNKIRDNEIAFQNNKIFNEIIPEKIFSSKILTKEPVGIDDGMMGETPAANAGEKFNSELEEMCDETRVWAVLNLATSKAASFQSDSRFNVEENWNTSFISAQIREIMITEWIARRQACPYSVDFDYNEFLDNYTNVVPAYVSPEGLQEWFMQNRGWSIYDAFFGTERIWITDSVWQTLESEQYQSINPQQQFSRAASGIDPFSEQGPNGSNVFSQGDFSTPDLNKKKDEEELLADDYLTKNFKVNDDEANIGGGKAKPVVLKTTMERRLWVAFTWAMTWWIPSFLLKYVGRIKRQEMRMAWREKFVICAMIFISNAFIIFYMIFLTKITCPDSDSAWNIKEVGYHTGTSDYYAAIHGKVYNFSKFYKKQHSDTSIETTSSTMLEFAGLDLSDYFPKPLYVACPSLVTSKTLWLTPNNTISYTNAIHYSGPYKVTTQTSVLYNSSWYDEYLVPGLKKYYKGSLVVSKKKLASQADRYSQYWATVNGTIYDLTNYFYSLDLYDGDDTYEFLDTDVTDLFKDNAGTDITKKIKEANLNQTMLDINMNCIKEIATAGIPDFRKSARCQASNYILLGYACLLSAVTIGKFLAALQFGFGKKPSPQSKYVICQIPAYTEDEQALRYAIDSITTLNYDNQKKLLFVICDGVITGSGNDKSTAQIVLDIFGVDEKYDPPALPFRSIGEGLKKLNYGKVYSGLYEFEGSVCPYIVIVKVGKESEHSKPGNRGKRDTQMMLFKFLNKVHYQRPMCPLELEVFHHINNIIGVDPELYEYIFMIDADTMTTPEALTILISSCVRDRRIIGTCGETKLMNEENSLFTMLQIYEYFISHHLTKAFESLFGSVTCLPGCFSLYRIRTADKGQPLIISDDIIREYSVDDIDTLHKKNLFSLGEDRYLTTLVTKYFPQYHLKFNADALARTTAPEEFSVLLSQRRRWINSTVHNLVEMLKLKKLCGALCFSMRFIIFVDLLGTVLMPSVFVYLVYLVYVIASGSTSFPTISLIMIAGTYGLQAIIYVMKKQFMLIGWMVVYFIMLPLHSFILPIYSFWYMDDFSWGNTRVVVEEKDGKKVVAITEEEFDENSIPIETWAEYAMRNNLPGAIRPAEYFNRNVVVTNKYSAYNSELAEMNMTTAKRQASSNYESGSQFNNGSEYYQMQDLKNPNSFQGNNYISPQDTPGRPDSRLTVPGVPSRSGSAVPSVIDTIGSRHPQSQTFNRLKAPTPGPTQETFQPEAYRRVSQYSKPFSPGADQQVFAPKPQSYGPGMNMMSPVSANRQQSISPNPQYQRNQGRSNTPLYNNARSTSPDDTPLGFTYGANANRRLQ